MINGLKSHLGMSIILLRTTTCSHPLLLALIVSSYKFYFPQKISFLSKIDRYDQWTGPEYYRLADQNLRVSTENRKKTKALEERREKLKNLFEAENEQYAKEIEGILRQ